MRAFVLGIILTIVAAFIVVLLIAQFGLFPTNADANPSSLERRIAMSAMDASMDRHAPRVSNPVPVTDSEPDRRNKALHHELCSVPRHA
jgi:hypothetical protein